MTQLKTKQNETSDLEYVSESNPLQVKVISAAALTDPQWRTFEALTVSSTVVGFATLSEDDRFAFVTCESAAVRYRLDGGAPTTTTGHVIEAGDIVRFSGNLTQIRFIRRDGVDATLSCSFGS